MPTTPLGDLLDQVANQIYAAIGAGVSADYDTDVQVTGRRNPQPTPPSIDVFPRLNDTIRGDDSAGFKEVHGAVLLTVRARVAYADETAGQDLLLRFVDDEDDLSVAAALFDDQTLGGLASSVKVDPPVGFEPTGDEGLLTVEWPVRIERLLS